jgi:hypothetical protein
MKITKIKITTTRKVFAVVAKRDYKEDDEQHEDHN